MEFSNSSYVIPWPWSHGFLAIVVELQHSRVIPILQEAETHNTHNLRLANSLPTLPKCSNLLPLLPSSALLWPSALQDATLLSAHPNYRCPLNSYLAHSHLSDTSILSVCQQARLRVRSERSAKLSSNTAGNNCILPCLYFMRLTSPTPHRLRFPDL